MIMNRRKFALAVGGTVMATSLGRASAQSAPADPALLTTTLTPFGGERAGNADGSIPAWTGGIQVQPNSPTYVEVFTDEKPYLTISAENMAQYQSLLTAGVMEMMQKYGYSIQVYPTHRTASAPQYVYDNIAKNVTRAQLNPEGGRLGFTNAYSGVPFPIPDTSDPLVGGAQIIWNHLTKWEGFYTATPFTASFTVSGGVMNLSSAIRTQYVYSFYDPDGSPETFDGYLFKSHLYFLLPSTFDGQEDIIWHTANTLQHPDITWTLLNGQGRVRKAPDEAYDTPSSATDGITNYDESECFYGNPSQYDWTYIGKQELFVPYHQNKMLFVPPRQIFGPDYPNPDVIRYEKHRVWVIEANLHPGNRNVLARRRFYVDEDTWAILLGDCYDSDGKIAKVEIGYNRILPTLPGLTTFGSTTFNMLTGAYVTSGEWNYPPFNGTITFEPIDSSYFDPQQMAANASF
jgi:hypothetical protein